MIQGAVASTGPVLSEMAGMPSLEVTVLAGEAGVPSDEIGGNKLS
jgi:hypothetical protein